MVTVMVEGTFRISVRRRVMVRVLVTMVTALLPLMRSCCILNWRRLRGVCVCVCVCVSVRVCTRGRNGVVWT